MRLYIRSDVDVPGQGAGYFDIQCELADDGEFEIPEDWRTLAENTRKVTLKLVRRIFSSEQLGDNWGELEIAASTSRSIDLAVD